MHGKAAGVDAIHLSHPYSYRSTVAREQDRVRFHRAGGLPRELQICQSLSRGRLTGHQLPVRGPVMISINGVGKLDEEPTIDTPALDAASPGRLDHKDSEILLGSEHIERAIGIPGGNDHLGEDLRDLSRHLHTDRPIGRDHASVRRGRITGMGLSMGFCNV